MNIQDYKPTAEQLNNPYKFEIGQKVIYEGLIGIIENRDIYSSGKRYYGLVAEEDKEMTCNAEESECEPYEGQDIDQSEALFAANLNSIAIQNKVGKITDKYFRDGNH